MNDLENTNNLPNEPLTTLTGNPSLVNVGFNEPPYNPLHLVQQWLVEAKKLNVCEPNGLVLSTVDINQKPSSRVVLLKTINDTGVVFASSSNSKKGLDMRSNPYIAGTLWWRETMQQINFSGCVTTLPSSYSDKIWMGRTREAQAIAFISQQSYPILDEEFMRHAVTDLIHSDITIERPETWHAYHVEIEEIEFWLGNQDRFHHRLRYRLEDNIWNHQRLQP